MLSLILWYKIICVNAVRWFLKHCYTHIFATLQINCYSVWSKIEIWVKSLSFLRAVLTAFVQHLSSSVPRVHPWTNMIKHMLPSLPTVILVCKLHLNRTEINMGERGGAKGIKHISIQVTVSKMYWNRDSECSVMIFLWRFPLQEPLRSW